ncbi:MAG: radical SAM family heme chaperone HemW [Magnetococcales bacterium]|nr:radical SAM family heme chaperone HemW [Magnetococcales bacterium]
MYLKTFPLPKNRPLSLYLHLPFCAHKCPYCDFASQVENTLPEERYTHSLLKEIRAWRQWLATDDRPLASIFIGGGTPSLFQPASIATILEVISDQFDLFPTCEITLEANPESVTVERLSGYLEAGINRFSLGIQAFSDDRLKQLERPHRLAKAQAAIVAAREAGVDNLNLDLIFGTPGHTLEQWQGELFRALEFSPEHLSCYQLTVEPGTPFHVRKMDRRLPEEEIQLELFQETRSILSHHGYLPYEISNFAKPGYPCRHNDHYWLFGDYLGLGASAHGKWTGEDGATHRSVHSVSPESYMESMEADPPAIPPMTPVSPEEAASECLLMGLRRKEGMARALYREIAGADLLERKPREVERFVEEGLVRVTPERVWLTDKGLLLGDGVMVALV